MEENQRMTGSELEAFLSSHRRKAALAKVITYGSGAIMIVFMMTGMLPLTLVFLAAALIGGCILSKHTSAIKHALSENVVIGVLNEVFEDVDYAPFGKIDSVGASGMVFPFSYNNVYGSDRIRASYRGMRIELGSIELQNTEDYYDTEREVWEERKLRVFQGQWLICGLGMELAGDVHVSSEPKKLRGQHKSDRVETGNDAFDRRFLVTAENAGDACRILTPHMMERIIEMSDKIGKPVYISFLRNGNVHIAIQTGSELFELGKSGADAQLLRRKFLGEFHRFTDIIDALCFD